MPPAWYENAQEGDEREVGGTKWFVNEVNGDVIWWARTRYGRAEACSQKPKPRTSAVVNLYNMQHAKPLNCLSVSGEVIRPKTLGEHLKIETTQSQSSDCVDGQPEPCTCDKCDWRPLSFQEFKDQQTHIKRHPIEDKLLKEWGDGVWVTHEPNSYPGDFHTFAELPPDYEPPTIESIVETMRTFTEKYGQPARRYDWTRLHLDSLTKDLERLRQDLKLYAQDEFQIRPITMVAAPSAESMRLIRHHAVQIDRELFGDSEQSSCSSLQADEEQLESDH